MNSAGNLTVADLAAAALRCSRQQDYQQAAALYQQALQLAPSDPTLLFNYGAMLRIVGELGLAEEMLDRAIALRPDDFEALQLRSGLRRWSAEDNHVAALQKQLAQLEALDKPSPKAVVHLCYALAKELEDLGRYDESFAALKRGASLRRQHLNYKIDDDLATFEALLKVQKPSKPATAEQGLTERSPTPVFVVSLPRAGSTLLERMLGCAPGVHLAGELNQFPQAIGRSLKAKLNTPPASRAEMVEATSMLDMAEVGHHYLGQLPALPAGTTHVVDKLPLNLLNVGFIAAALPRARIIYVRRNKLDHGYAMYKHLFAQAYPWSYDLAEISQYYDASARLMDHWSEQWPERICTIDYEELVANPEQESRRAFAHCGLNWSPEVLDFHKANKAASTTGSASQIRQPLHSRSVGLAEHYLEHLKELTY
ncbi:tetratricopeptide repeat-containing sulfotransferase family protein [Pseudidiomarina salinarum]|uniref:tetratricopeptide repeat-containing sulfotransferase family protein n=1 Tax=Pseudidiomarina salinarum TaxID=435908 RepID=UPI00068DF035|nr:sulfotransferase [Pseudidiomarina salinarum]